MKGFVEKQSPFFTSAITIDLIKASYFRQIARELTIVLNFGTM